MTGEAAPLAGAGGGAASQANGAHASRPVCPRIEDKGRMLGELARCLKDESGLSGSVPERMYLPTGLEELRAAVEENAGSGGRLVVSGGRTGLVGGAVPQEGTGLLVLDRLQGGVGLSWSEERSCFLARVPASMTLAGLEEALGAEERAREWFYPVDPTETTASLGGNSATNASGAHSLAWGPTRCWTAGLTVILADGSAMVMERGPGKPPFLPGAASAPRTLRLSSGFQDGRVVTRELTLPGLRLPPVKNTAGYFTSGEPVDLFIGGEGTLGIIAEVVLALRRRPERVVGVAAFPRSPSQCLDLVERLKASGLPLLALELMDRKSLALLEKEGSGAPAGAAAMLYAEAECAPGDADRALERLARILLESGVREEDAWAASSAADFKKIREFRHALPERVNEVIARRAARIPGLAKLAADCAVPDAGLRPMMSAYDEALRDSRLDHVIFGHIGNAHLHLNILPESLEEMERGRAVCEELARRAVSLGGSVSGEHGIGRLKRRLMGVQFPAADLDAMRGVKTALDPHGLLNPGVIW